MPKLGDNAIHELGIFKGLYERYYKEHQETIAGCRKVYNEVAEKVKEKGDWCKISALKIKNTYHIPEMIIRATAYYLQEHPNIIGRINPRVAGLPRVNLRTVTPEYRYVSIEEKERLGYRAYGYKYASGEYLDRIEQCFSDKHDIHKNGLLALADTFIRRGADKEWIKVDIIVAAKETGITVEQAAVLLRNMYESKFMAIASVRAIGATFEIRPICRIAMSDEEYDTYEMEIVNGDLEKNDNLPWKSKKELVNQPTKLSVKPFQLFKRINMLRQRSIENMPMSDDDDIDPLFKEFSEIGDEGSEEQAVRDKISEIILSYRFKVEENLKEEYEERIRELTVIKERLEKINENLEQRVSDLNKKFLDAAADATNYRRQASDIETELKKIKVLNEKNAHFKEKLVDHLNEQLQILLSDMMELNIRVTSAYPYQLKDKTYIASIRKDTMEIINNVSREILNFTVEGVPNELVTSKERKGMAHATS